VSAIVPVGGRVGVNAGAVNRTATRWGRGRRRTSRAASIAAIAIALVWLFPVYWMIISAFKNEVDLETTPPQFFPTRFTLSEFTSAFHDGFLSALWVSILVSLTVVAFSMVLALFASLAVARFRFRGRAFLLVLLLVFQMVPFEALLIPIFIELNKAGLVFTIPALIIAYIAPTLPFTIWTLRGFVAGVPTEIEEAAWTDGCSRTAAFWKVLFPLIAPGLVATSIFAYILAWNEFAYANVLTNNADATLPVWLEAFINPSRPIPWGELMAGSVLFTIPVMVFFLIIQRRLSAGMTAGAVKG